MLKSSDRPGSAGYLLRKAVISRLESSANICSEASHPDPQRAGPTLPVLPEPAARTSTGQRPLTHHPAGQEPRHRPNPRTTSSPSLCPGEGHLVSPARRSPGRGQHISTRLCSSLPTSHYSAEPRNAAKPRLIPLPWKKVWAELLLGSLGIASEGQILADSRICGLGWLVSAVCRQIRATRGINSSFPRAAAHILSPRGVRRETHPRRT